MVSPQAQLADDAIPLYLPSILSAGWGVRSVRYLTKENDQMSEELFAIPGSGLKLDAMNKRLASHPVGNIALMLPCILKIFVIQPPATEPCTL